MNDWNSENLGEILEETRSRYEIPTLSSEIDDALTDFFEKFSREFVQMGLAASLFGKEVAKPHGVNEESGPDYEQMATEAVEKAKQTAPFLLKALGLEDGE